MPLTPPTLFQPSSLFSHSSAAPTLAPLEPPTRRPSVRIRRLHVANESGSADLIQCVTASCERTAGTCGRAGGSARAKRRAGSRAREGTHKVVAGALNLQEEAGRSQRGVQGQVRGGPSARTHLVDRALAVLEHVEALGPRQNAADRIDAEADQVRVGLAQALREARQGAARTGAGDDNVDEAARGSSRGRGDGGDGREELDGRVMVVGVGVCAQRKAVSPSRSSSSLTWEKPGR